MNTLGVSKYVGYGADDISIRKVPVELNDLGQVVNKSYIFAAKGNGRDKVVDADGVKAAYGDETFAQTGPFYNHSTRFLERFLKYGGTSVVRRIIPSDAKNPANLNIYLDYIEKEYPNYERDSLGNYVFEGNSKKPKVVAAQPTINGIEIKLIADFVEGVDTLPTLGTLVPKSGTMVNGDAKSTMVPFMQIPAKEAGAFYNLIGLGFDSPLETDLDMDVIHELGAMLYDFKIYMKPSEKSKPQVLSTLLGEKSIRVCLKEKAINYKTRGDISFNSLYESNYYNETDTSITMRDKDLEGVHIYNDNLELVLGKIMELEKQHVTDTLKTWHDGETASSDEWFGYDPDKPLTEQLYMINLFTCKSVKNKPYFAVRINTDKPVVEDDQNYKEVRFTNNTPVMLAGGQNGTMSLEEFNRAVNDDLGRYIDKTSRYLNPVLSPESFIFDPGFPIDTKLKLFNFITIRKDTNVLFTPYDYSAAKKGLRMSASDELAVLRAINAGAMLAPESTYHNTECGRAMVVIGGGLLPGNGKEIIPNSYELLSRISQMMSGKNWNENFIFDDSCYSRHLVDITPEFIPDDTKPVFTNLGAIYPEPVNGGRWKFINLQTLYSIQESAMNNLFTAVAISTADRLARYNWLKNSGNMRDPDDVFLANVENDMNEDLKDRFAKMIVASGTANMTNMDKAAGSSYHMKTKLQASIAKSTAYHTTEIDRREEN